MEQFPGNNPQKDQRQNKEVKPLLTEGVTVRKKPVRKKFLETFFAGSPQEAGRQVLWDILLPRAKDLLRDAGHGAIDYMMYANDARKFTTNSQAGRTNYGQVFQGSKLVNQQPRQAISPAARARHDFDELVFDSRDKAQMILDGLSALIDTYGVASVADFYDLTGVTLDHPSEKWGWSNLANAGIANIGGAYILNLPKPEPLK